MPHLGEVALEKIEQRTFGAAAQDLGDEGPTRLEDPRGEVVRRLRASIAAEAALRIVSGALVEGLVEDDAGRVKGLRLGDGSTYACEEVVIAAGTYYVQVEEAGNNATIAAYRRALALGADGTLLAAWSDFLLEEPELWGVEMLAADSVDIRLVLKTQPGMQWKVMRELRIRLKEALDAAAIEIPFQQRTLWIRNEGEVAAGPLAAGEGGAEDLDEDDDEDQDEGAGADDRDDPGGDADGQEADQ